jgi:hypothetical protein
VSEKIAPRAAVPPKMPAVMGDGIGGQVATCSTIELVRTRWSASNEAAVATKEQQLKRAANDGDTELTTACVDRQVKAQVAIAMTAATPDPSERITNVSLAPAALTTRPAGKRERASSKRATPSHAAAKEMKIGVSTAGTIDAASPPPLCFLDLARTPTKKGYASKNSTATRVATDGVTQTVVRLMSISV